MTGEDLAPEYDAVEIPPDKPTENYHYTERRADLLARLREKGTPVNLPSQSDLATQYGVSQSVISRDFDLLAEYIESSLGKRHVMTTQAAFDRALAGALAEEQWEAASRIADRRASWVRERTILHRLDEKLDQLIGEFDNDGVPPARDGNVDSRSPLGTVPDREVSLPEVLPIEDGRIVVGDLDGVEVTEDTPSSEGVTGASGNEDNEVE